jgi:ankyrin repeat protein
MIDTNYSDSYYFFTQNLNKLSDSRYSIITLKDDLILEKRITSENVFKFSLKTIKKYLIKHQSQLQPSDINKLRKLEQNLLKESLEEDKKLKISKIFDLLIANINKHSVFSDQKKDQSISVVLRISPPPQNLQDLRENLRLFLSHAPRYQLGNSLEIYDTNSFQLPANWDPAVVVQNLHKAFEGFLTQIEKSDSQLVEIERQECQELYQEAVKLLAQRAIITLAVVHETSSLGTDKAAMYLNAKEFIKAGKPVVTNRHFFNVHEKRLSHLKKFYPFDVYLQKEGGLCVVLPKGKNPEIYGFKKEGLQKWENDHLNLPLTSLDFAENSRTLFKEDTQDRQFLRIIVMVGHGIYPKKTYSKSKQKEGCTAGFSSSELQKQMQVFKEHHMVFCVISSCYSGGVNAENIHLPDQTISCPMIVLSSLETKGQAHQNKFLPLLSQVQKQLFPAGEKTIFYPKPLTKQNLNAIAQQFPPNLRIFNLPSCFLPKNRADIPTIPSALIKETSHVLDVSHVAKIGSQQPFIDQNLNRKAIFFSEPIVPFSITCSGSMPLALLSRGSNAYHVIEELNLPEKDIEAIGSSTFNLSDYQNTELNGSSPATKTFFMKTMQCKVEGKKKTLQHVMLMSSSTSCQIQFQMEGETDFRRLIFVKKKELWEPSSPLERISREQGHAQIYQAIHQANPSDKTLEMTTGGTLSRQELLATFNEIFWGTSLLLDLQLASALLSNSPIFEKEEITGKVHRSTLLKKILEDIQRQLKLAKGTSTEEELLSILREASDLAFKMGKTEEVDQIKAVTFTPLIHAVVAGSLEKVKEVLEKDFSMIDTPQLNGSTPLFLACSLGHQAIAQYLLEKGANPILENRFQKTPFELAAEKGYLELMGRMLSDQRLNIKDKIGAEALKSAFKSNQRKTIIFLLHRRAGEQTDVSHLLYNFPFNKKSASFLKKLLTYPTYHINQQFKPHLTTPLFVCIKKRNVKAIEQLLDHGALVNISDEQERSPLIHAILSGKEHSLSMVELLLKKGASVNSKNKDGNFPLHLAIDKGNMTMVDLLLTYGASWNVANEKGQSLLEFAFKKNPELLRAIAKHPSFKIDLPDGKGQSPLSRAFSQGNLELAKALINLGADINQKQEEKPLVLSYLLENMSKSRPEVFEFFLSQKAVLHLQDEEGNTALHYAALFMPDVYLSRIVTENLDLLHVKNKRGETPLMFLAKQEDLSRYKAKFDILIEHDNHILEQDIEGLLAHLLDISTLVMPCPAKVLIKKAYFSLNAKQRASPTYALHAAILEGQTQILELVKKPSSTSLFGLSEPMSLLAFLYHPSKLKMLVTLIEGGANIHAQAPDGSTLLHQAAKRGDAALVKLLIEKGINPTVLDKKGKTAFDQYDGPLSLEFIDVMTEKGWDVTGQLGLDLLKCVLRRHFLHRDKEIFDRLIQGKAGSQIEKNHLLVQAIARENSEAIEIFLKDPLANLNDSYLGQTPLSWAISQGNLDLFRLLLEKKADPNIPSMHGFPKKKEDPLQQILLSTIEREKGFQMADLLLQHGADLSSVDENKNSLLHLAVINDDLPLATYLLSKGIPANLKNDQNLTPLEIAARHYRGELYDLLKKAN